ncbi:unnamed protein product [Leptidea sinapis]|uniref:Uncharacterized protein n=1 Tax=Leptidea sinapis TaxID=189913 RepID=A0A5E4QK98_9NEOP|nr:unnamed protein product [Leptidea sinapis]
MLELGTPHMIFEEKRLKQSETLKKANLLKFSVFKKSNTEAAAQASAGESGAGASRARGATGVAARSSFSKFEEKRLKQSETLKKANLLKFSVFKKSNTG